MDGIHVFQSLKGLILTILLRVSLCPTTGISIPQRSDFNDLLYRS